MAGLEDTGPMGLCKTAKIIGPLKTFYDCPISPLSSTEFRFVRSLFRTATASLLGI